MDGIFFNVEDQSGLIVHAENAILRLLPVFSVGSSRFRYGGVWAR
jgi:hypothetical protein